MGTPILAEAKDMLELLRAETGYLDKIRPTNRNVQFTCPFHGGGHEKKPSCGVSTNTVKRNGKIYPEGTVHCFTCGYTATDFSEFVSNLFGKEDGGLFGYKWITKNFYSVQVDERKPLDLNMGRGKVTTVEREYITEEELDKYRYYHDYMFERKLTEKVINYFDVGYDSEANAITFPVNDKQGRTLYIQRRSIGTKFFQNPEVEKGVTLYGIDKVWKNIEKVKELVITESPIDALTVWVYGGYAVALLGSEPLPPQVKLLRELPIRKFISGLDNDEAGEKGTAKLKAALPDKLLYRYLFPENKNDLNEFSESEYKRLRTCIY